MTVNIDGIVFHIDNDAYERLQEYLDKIRHHFSSDEGCDEIIAGIESRIAEVFHDKKKDPRRVITLTDVEDAIAQLGEPSQISGDNDEREKGSKGDDEKETDDDQAPKKLFRDPDNKYIGGVCGGLGAYFVIDPTWIRVIFLLTLFLGGGGLIVYVILWIVMPKARTMGDRLSMKGEKPNLSNIEKSIREDLRDLKRKIESL